MPTYPNTLTGQLRRFADEATLSLDPRIQLFIDKIKDEDGVDVYPRKPLVKFGRFSNLGTSRQIIQTQGGLDVEYPSADTITHVSSTSAADTMMLEYEGRVTHPSGLEFVTGETYRVQLQGQTKVALPVPVRRATRSGSLAARGTNIVGTVSFYEDTAITAGLPDDASKIQLQINADASSDTYPNQSEKCQTALSYKDYWLILAANGGVLKKTAASVDFAVQFAELDKVFRDKYQFPGSTGAGLARTPLEVPLLARPNSDVRMIGKATATGVEAVCTLAGVLLTVIE